MTGGSDDARPPADEPNAVDAAWDALVEETGKDEEDSGRAASTGEPPAGEPPAGEPSTSSTPPSLTAATSATLHARADDEMARLMEGDEPKPASTTTRPRPSSQDVPARASRPLEPGPSTPSPAARGLPWAWIGAGALALGAVTHLVTQEGSSNDGRPETQAPVTAPEPTRSAPSHVPDLGSAIETQPSEGDDAGPHDANRDESPNPNAEARTGDPREPPSGTPPEIAAVFRRLPVSPSDRPPVGGIGASGIHIDHIAMGSETTGATCSGKPDDFSVSARERAGVCVRVVHPREKEELQVLWEKHGGSTRRSKMVVLPMHAYRTRGYLVLRSEYIGDWTVRILSSDGVELAHHEFTVVP